MRFGTSFFNFTLFRKNLTRFWPIWSLYTVILVLMLPIDLLLNNKTYNPEFLPHRIYNSLSGGHLLLILFFAILAVMAVFSYLYNSRSVQLFHALPVKRSGLFFTNYLSGLSFLVIPIWVAGLLALAVQGSFGMGALGTTVLWTFLATLETLFFYSFAVFCAMFTGHLLALPAFYVILNLLFLGLYTLLQSLFSRFVYGFFRLDWLQEVAFWLTPALRLMREVSVSYPEGADALPIFFGGMPSVFLYALLGIVLTLLALVAYRKRRLESAGDVISILWVRPIFKYGVAFCSAIFLGSLLHDIFAPGLSDSVWPLLACLLVSGVVGYFAAEMLLRKTFKVFRKSWKGVVVFSLALTLAVCAMEFDVLGFNRAPSPNSVSSVTLSGVDGYPQDGADYALHTFTSAEDIALVTELHSQLAAAKSTAPRLASSAETTDGTTEETDRYITLQLSYTLKNGSDLFRSYNVLIYLADLETPGTVPYLLNQLTNRPDEYYNYYFQNQPTGSENALIDASISLYDTAMGYYVDVTLPDEAGRERLLAAIEQDLRNGDLGRRYLFDNKERRETCSVGDIILTFYRTEPQSNPNTYDEPESGYTWSLTITPQSTATRTIKVLTDLGIIDSTHPLLTHTDRTADYPATTSTTLVPDRAVK